MTFNQVLKDLEKMQGMLLQSIRSGAELTIENMDWEHKRIILKGANGETRSRTFSELERVWEALRTNIAIHVDTILSGSGSSRNQPETLLANLPYVEWFRHSRKKHLCLVNEPSHNYGTLKKLDEIISEDLRSKINSKIKDKITIKTKFLVVSGDIANHALELESITGVRAKSLDQGNYEFLWNSCQIMLVGSSTKNIDVQVGTYLVITDYSGKKGKPVFVAGEKYWLYSRQGLNILFAD